MTISDSVRIQNKILDIAKSLTAEKDFDKLLYKIVYEARSITNADGGTLYLFNQDELHYKIMQTDSMNLFTGGNGEEIDIQPIKLNKDHISSYCAMTKQLVNIKDVYETELFDFSGPKTFDRIMNYKTKSMLVCPLISRKEKVVGVLQLINAVDEQGQLIPFNKEYESIILSLASQAGISIENMQYIEDIRKLFESFVQVIAKTIDERSPYNKRHTENLARRIQEFVEYINTIDYGPLKDLNFDEIQQYKLKTAAWLHDIGKIVVPLEVLDKPTRLDYRYGPLMARLSMIQIKLERNYFKKTLEKGYSLEVEDNFKKMMKAVEDIKALIDSVNKPSTYVDEELREKLIQASKMKLEGIDDPIITEEELLHLSITKGTLTDGERLMVQNHITAGARILAELEFPDYLEGIYDWIIKHHEYLDGSGYDKGISGEHIKTESRLMTILDIYDALVQSDRPYKKAYTPEKAIRIIQAMSDEGKLDKDLVKAYVESGLWKK